jgi:GxGYxYP putative glycoside hydrolase C-terminal domain/GxGYxY sequence motif in domain of unknown function N-terminal/Secretion system C-terminal sorting domain
MFLVNINGMPASQQLTVVTLQGLLAKSKPRIMVQRSADIFISDLQNYGVTYDSTYLNDFSGLLNHFKNEFTGYVECNHTDTVINAAISICSPLNAIAVDSVDTQAVNSLGIPLLYNVIGKGQVWAFDTFQNQYNHRIIDFQEATKCTYLSDYSVFTGAFHFWDVLALTDLSYAAFRHVQLNGALLGWGDEHTTVFSASQYGLHVHAADFASNLSVYSNFNVPVHQKNHSTDTTIIPGKHTVCFVMTDGDNVQWLTNNFATNPGWYGSQHRGEVNIGWTVSPAMAELAPTVLKYFYDSAASTPAGQDYFVAAPSGMGYTYPSDFSPLDSGAAITDRMLHKADLRIQTIIDDTYQPYVMQDYLQQPDIDAVLFFSYGDGYMGLDGFTDCYYGKPVISAKYSLWGGVYSPASLAQVLDTLPKDPYSTDGYSLVDVHVWDNTVDSVIKCAQLLDTNVRVVTPDAFVKLFSKGTNCKAYPAGLSAMANGRLELRASPNPFSDQTEVSFFMPVPGKTKLTLYNALGQQVEKIMEADEVAGGHLISVNTSNLPSGFYYFLLQADGVTITYKCMLTRN